MPFGYGFHKIIPGPIQLVAEGACESLATGICIVVERQLFPVYLRNHTSARASRIVVPPENTQLAGVGTVFGRFLGGLFQQLKEFFALIDRARGGSDRVAFGERKGPGDFRVAKAGPAAGWRGDWSDS